VVVRGDGGGRCAIDLRAVDWWIGGPLGNGLAGSSRNGGGHLRTVGRSVGVGNGLAGNSPPLSANVPRTF
jgi:hypothetical protein